MQYVLFVSILKTGGDFLKKTKLILVIFIVLILLVGCENKQKKIDELRSQALIYLDESDFENSIELYNKMLEIEEDDSIREELKEIKYEKESVEKTKLFLDVIKDVNINYNRSNSLVELKDVFLELQKAIDEIEKLDTEKETDIAKYLSEIKNLDDYKYLKDLIRDEYVMDAEKSESLSSIQSSFGLGNSLSYGSALIIGQANQNLKQHTDYILKIKIPQRYENKL